MKILQAPWSKADDDLFRQLVERKTPVHEIEARLDRNIQALRYRAYVIGLPRKWHKEPIASPRRLDTVPAQ